MYDVRRCNCANPGSHSPIAETGRVRGPFRKADITSNLSRQLATSSVGQTARLEARHSHKNYVRLSQMLFTRIIPRHPGQTERSAVPARHGKLAPLRKVDITLSCNNWVKFGQRSGQPPTTLPL